MRIHYFTPFSVEKNFLTEIDYYMNLLPGEHDWACILDGDTLFLRPDFGNCILKYVKQYPETGLFTSYASRCHYQRQVPLIGDTENSSIAFHRGVANQLHKRFQSTCEFKTIDMRIAGHLMLLKKATWLQIRDRVFAICLAGNKKILGIDTQISEAVLAEGMDIKLMRSIYLLHYLRFCEGYGFKGHLQ